MKLKVEVVHGKYKIIKLNQCYTSKVHSISVVPRGNDSEIFRVFSGFCG